MPLGEYANFKGGSPSKELFMTGSGKGKMSSVQPGTKEMRDLETILHRCLKRIFFSDPSLCSNEYFIRDRLSQSNQGMIEQILCKQVSFHSIS